MTQDLISRIKVLFGARACSEKAPCRGLTAPPLSQSQTHFNSIYTFQSRYSCPKLWEKEPPCVSSQRTLVSLWCLTAMTNWDEGRLHARAFSRLTYGCANAGNAILLHLIRRGPFWYPEPNALTRIKPVEWPSATQQWWILPESTRRSRLQSHHSSEKGTFMGLYSGLEQAASFLLEFKFLAQFCWP